MEKPSHQKQTCVSKCFLDRQLTMEQSWRFTEESKRFLMLKVLIECVSYFGQGYFLASLNICIVNQRPSNSIQPRLVYAALLNLAIICTRDKKTSGIHFLECCPKVILIFMAKLTPSNLNISFLCLSSQFSCFVPFSPNAKLNLCSHRSKYSKSLYEYQITCREQYNKIQRMYNSPSILL